MDPDDRKPAGRARSPLTIMAVLLSRLQVPLTWPEVFRRTFREAIKANCFGMAAQLAYYRTLRRHV